jgi:hypothetical protein
MAGFLDWLDSLNTEIVSFFVVWVTINGLSWLWGWWCSGKAWRKEKQVVFDIMFNPEESNTPAHIKLKAIEDHLRGGGTR